jgi:hypothetical protein
MIQEKDWINNIAISECMVGQEEQKRKNQVKRKKQTKNKGRKKKRKEEIRVKEK